MTNKHCKRCGKPSGAYQFCPAHRKENRAKARASRQASSGRASRIGSSVPMTGYNLTTAASFPTANASYYDQAPAIQDASSQFSPEPTVARLLKAGA